jgi:IS6 family transposase
MLKRGIEVDHTTLYRWVQRSAPEIERQLYRAIDKRGHTIDFYLSSTRNIDAAKRFWVRLYKV